MSVLGFTFKPKRVLEAAVTILLRGEFDLPCINKPAPITAGIAVCAALANTGLTLAAKRGAIFARPWPANLIPASATKPPAVFYATVFIAF